AVEIELDRRMLAHHAGDLALQCAKKRADVEAADRILVEVLRAGTEIVGDGDRRRGGENRLAGMFAEPLQQHVAAEGRAEGNDRDGELRCECARYEIEISRLARVVEARPPVEVL